MMCATTLAFADALWQPCLRSRVVLNQHTPSPNTPAAHPGLHTESEREREKHTHTHTHTERERERERERETPSRAKRAALPLVERRRVRACALAVVAADHD